MKRNRQLLWGSALLLCLFAGAGCGGFQGSKSVSPASFLLPGLGKAGTTKVPDVVVVTPTDSNGLIAAH